MNTEKTPDSNKIQSNHSDSTRRVKSSSGHIPLGWALAMIALYCVSASWAKGNFSSDSPIMTLVLLADALVITGLLVFKKWISVAGLSFSGLRSDSGSESRIRRSLFHPCFLALFLIALPNLIFVFLAPADVSAQYGNKLIFAIVSMALVGYLEEVVFRGMLFEAIAATSLRQAVIITSLTFGIGHIANLFTGQNLFETLVQIAYAIAIGYAFVVARIASGSIWIPILVHALVDVFSIFIASSVSSTLLMAGGLALIVISLGCAWLIIRSNPKRRYF